jgi:hypothetical protein
VNNWQKVQSSFDGGRKYKPWINYGLLIDPCETRAWVCGCWHSFSLMEKNWFTLGPVFTLGHRSRIDPSVFLVYFPETILQVLRTLNGLFDELWHLLAWFRWKN